MATPRERHHEGRAATGHLALEFTPSVLRAVSSGLQLVLSEEDEPRGTAGALRQALPLLSSSVAAPVVVVNGDSLSAHDLIAQLHSHASAQAGITLHVRAVPDARAFGLVECAPDGRVTAFSEKPADPVTGLVNAGTYVVQSHLLAAMAGSVPLSLERDVLPAWVGEGHVRSYREDSYAADLGTPTSLLAASVALVEGRVPDALVPPTGAHSGAVIDPTARMIGGSYADAGAVVGPGAVVDASIVSCDARVERGAEVVRSIVAPGARVQAGSRVVDKVVT